MNEIKRDLSAEVLTLKYLKLSYVVAAGSCRLLLSKYKSNNIYLALTVVGMLFIRLTVKMAFVVRKDLYLAIDSRKTGGQQINLQKTVFNT